MKNNMFFRALRPTARSADTLRTAVAAASSTGSSSCFGEGMMLRFKCRPLVAQHTRREKGPNETSVFLSLLRPPSDTLASPSAVDAAVYTVISVSVWLRIIEDHPLNPETVEDPDP